MTEFIETDDCLIIRPSKCDDRAAKDKEIEVLKAGVVQHLSWMIAHFEWAREQTGLSQPESPELAAAKQFLTRCKELI